MARLWKIGGVVAIFVSLGVVGGGCGPTGKTTVLEAPTAPGAFRAPAVTIVEWPPTVEMPDKHRALLRKSIDEGVTGKGGLPAGPGLRINYRIVQFDKGSRFERHFWRGLGAGEGSVTLEADYYEPPNPGQSTGGDDGDATPLARIRIQAGIRSGIFGGSFREVYDRVAREIRDFTLKNFR